MRLSVGLEKRMQSRQAVPIKLEAMIDQGVHRVATLLRGKVRAARIGAQPSARLICGKVMRPGRLRCNDTAVYM